MSETAGHNLPPMPLLTADLPGVGGCIRAEPEDFRVEELPLYEPSGEGTHTWLWVEKRGIASMELVNRLARALGRRPQEIGLAGLKDARAVTRQWLSVEHVDPDRARDLAGDLWRVLDVSRHTNKLRIGHLRGNRFDILIRDVTGGAAPQARAVIERLVERGLPNHFGPQRFGARGTTHLLGLALVRKDWPGFCRLLLGDPRDDDPPAGRRFRTLYEQGDLRGARRAVPRGDRDATIVLDALIRSRGNEARAARAVPKAMRRFYVSACQSAVFNEVLARRMPELGRLEAGDLAHLHGRGAVFRVDEPVAEQPRADRFEISPTGPLPGYKMVMPGGRPCEVEAAVLAEAGLAFDDFRGGPGGGVKGARRPLRVPLAGATVEPDSGGLRLQFELPAGCYATTVLAEVMKTAAIDRNAKDDAALDP